MEESKVLLPTLAFLSLGFVITFTVLFFVFQVVFFPIELSARVIWSGLTYFLRLPKKLLKTILNLNRHLRVFTQKIGTT